MPHQFYSLPSFARMLKADAQRNGLPFTMQTSTIALLHAEGLAPTVTAVLYWAEADPEKWLDDMDSVVERISNTRPSLARAA